MLKEIELSYFYLQEFRKNAASSNTKRPKPLAPVEPEEHSHDDPALEMSKM